MLVFSSLVAVGERPSGPPVDCAIYDAVAADSSSSGLSEAINPYYETITEKLRSLGLRKQGSVHSIPATCVTVLVVVLGWIRIAQGFIASQEVGFTAVLSMSFFIIALIVNARLRHGTAASKELMERLQLQAKEKRNWRDGADIPATELALCVAVLGPSVLSGMAGFSELDQALTKFAPTQFGWAASGGCGSGCGGGGCGGGGCGGCGGCGG